MSRRHVSVVAPFGDFADSDDETNADSSHTFAVEYQRDAQIQDARGGGPPVVLATRPIAPAAPTSSTSTGPGHRRSSQSIGLPAEPAIPFPYHSRTVSDPRPIRHRPTSQGNAPYPPQESLEQQHSRSGFNTSAPFPDPLSTHGVGPTFSTPRHQYFTGASSSSSSPFMAPQDFRSSSPSAGDFPTYGSGSLHRAGQQHSQTSSGASGSTSFSPSLPLNAPASFAPATSFPPGYGDVPPPAAHQQHQSGASTSSSLSYSSSVATPQLQPTVSFDDMLFSDYFDLIFGATPPPLTDALAAQHGIPSGTYASTSSSLPGLAASVSVPPYGAPTATYYPPPGPPAQHQGLYTTSLVAPIAQPAFPPLIPAPLGGWGRCRPNAAGRDNRWRYPRREGNLNFMCSDTGCSTPSRDYTTVGAVTSHLRGPAHKLTVQGSSRYLTTSHNNVHRLICPYERCGKHFDVSETGKMDDHVRYHRAGRWCPTCFATYRGLFQNHECE